MDTTDSDTTKHYAWLGKLIAEDRNSNDSTCDLVLESERKQFPVHKNIMMLVSKYFKKMFTIEMKEKYEVIVKMLQIPHQRLANLIEFIYTGRIKITEENVTDLLDDAEYTELEALKKICNTALLKLVSADNCLKLRAYAQRYNLDEVFVKTNQEITTSFATVVRQNGFVQLDVDDLSSVIKLRNRNCEEALFTGIVQWADHNPLQCEKLFVNLFSQMDFTLMSSDFLAQISTEDLVRNNAECLRLLVDAFAKVSRPTFIGKFLIIGGVNSLYDCVIYDVNTKQPTTLPELNIEREVATSVKIGSKVYVAGGWANDAGESCEMLNLDEPTNWNVMPNLLEFRSCCGSGIIANHIYITGGVGQHYDELSSCEKFDIHNNKWIRINNMLHARRGHGTVVCNDLLYCIGGYSDPNNKLSSCECYDVGSDVWNEIAPLNQARADLTSVVLDGNIYAIGGHGEDFRCLSTVERLNPGIGKWENIASLQHARYCSSACVVGNKIYVIGGSDGEEDLTSVEVYDPTSNVWTIAFEIEKPVYGATAVAV